MAVQEYAIQMQGGPIRYWTDTDAGEGAPWLAFLPGLTADHRLFDRQMEHFSGKANCLVWDPPAHGDSRPFALDFTMDGFAHMLHDVLADAGATKPVLVGQSMGGYVSQAFIDLYPGEAAGFISVDSAPLKRKSPWIPRRSSGSTTPHGRSSSSGTPRACTRPFP